MRVGYVLTTEQAGPQDLVRHAARAEQAGVDFEMITDHYSPWLVEQGHSPYAWAVLGAVSQRTERVELMTCVTCPTFRYHPAVVAQKAATLQLLTGNRFTLGLGSGENLNEHVVGKPWPALRVRHEMLVEALEIIGRLFDGESLTYRGRHFTVQDARLWDRPPVRVPTAVAVGGPKSVQRFAPLADGMVSVMPDADLVDRWQQARPGSRKIAQLAVCWDPDRDAALERLHQQFRWVVSGWPVNAVLAGPEAVAEATTGVRAQDLAAVIPTGPDLDGIVGAAKLYRAAGFTDLALYQVGGQHQDAFLDVLAAELLAALRD